MKNLLNHKLIAVIALGLQSAAIAQAPSGMEASQVRAAATPVTSGRRQHVVQRAAVFVNGRAMDFNGASLSLQRGRLYVPLRAISEAAGAIVSYDAATSTISIQRGQRVVQLTLRPVTPRVMVPLRFLSENLGAQVRLIEPRVDNISEVYIDWANDSSTPPAASFPSPPVNQPPVASPSQPLPSVDKNIEAAVLYNFQRLNAHRARAGAPALLLDPGISDFARQGSLELKQNHQAHGHFRNADVWASGFAGGAAENQGDPNGWPIRGGLNATIDAILQAMINEGPGGGHHDNMLNPKFRRVGIGLVVDGNKLYLTNDFSQ